MPVEGRPPACLIRLTVTPEDAKALGCLHQLSDAAEAYIRQARNQTINNGRQ